MPQILEDNQGAFTLERGPIDNAHVVIGTSHSIIPKDRHLSNGKPCITIKLDMSKTYDRLNWNFFHYTLKVFNFPNRLIEIIMKCVFSTSIPSVTMAHQLLLFNL